MRSRTQDMWWGPAIEAPDSGALARFYAALLDWPVVAEEPGTTVLAGSQPQEHVRVLLDPAGHPFCLVLQSD